MLVSDSLLIHSNPFQSKNSILLAQPAGIKLIVRYDEEKHNSDGGGEESNSEKQNLPSFQ